MVEVKNQLEASENKSEWAKLEANVAKWTDKQKEEGASNFEKNTANSEKMSNVNKILDITRRFFFADYKTQDGDGKNLVKWINDAADQESNQTEALHNIVSYKKLSEVLSKNDEQWQNIASLLEPILSKNAWYAYAFLDELLTKFDKGQNIQKIHIDTKTNYFVKYDGKMQNIYWLFQNPKYNPEDIKKELSTNHKKLYAEYLALSTNQNTSASIGQQEVKTLSSFSTEQSMALQGNDQTFFNRLSRYDWNLTPMSKFEEAQDQTRRSFYKNPFNAPNPIAYKENAVEEKNRTEVKIQTAMINIS